MKHFLILTNSSDRTKLGKEPENSYTAFRKVYPFVERDEQLPPTFSLLQAGSVLRLVHQRDGLEDGTGSTNEADL